MFVEVQTCATDVARQLFDPGTTQVGLPRCSISKIYSDVTPTITRVPKIFSILAC